MSVAAWDEWFSFSIRRNRKSFMLAVLMLLATYSVILGALYFFDVGRRSGLILTIAFFVPAAICYYSLTAQRLRDMNITGWLALLWIPIGFLPDPINAAVYLAAWIVLCAVPGTEGSNRFGADPLRTADQNV